MMRAFEYPDDTVRGRYFRMAFERAPIGIALVNDKHEITDVNQALCDILGYTKAELVGISFRTVTHPDDLKATIINHEKLFSGLVQSYQLTKRYIRNNGQCIWCRVSVSRAYDEQSNTYYAIAHVEDAYQEKLLAIERKVLARISAQESLKDILDTLTAMVEEISPGIKCSILLLDEDGEHLRHGSATGLPESYNKAIDGLKIGPQAGSCGTAAYQRRPVITVDVTKDPRWAEYRDLAMKYGLRACWSTPVISTTDKVLGTFAIYYNEPKQPPTHHKRLIRQITDVVGIAISRDREREQLRLSEEKYRALYDENPVMYVTLDQDSRILSVNRHARDILNYHADELLGRPGFSLVHLEDIEVARQNLQNCLTNLGVVHNFMIRIMKADNTYIWTRLSGRAIRDAAGKISILVVGEDVTEIQDLSDQLLYQASHDDLTGLINRREFEIRLNHALDVARKDRVEHAVCYMDLDQFKVVNDSCGHIAGDELLRQISALLRRHLRKSDVLARLGGDEFGILMEYCDLNVAMTIARKILDEIREFRFVWDNTSFSVSLSIGIAPITSESGTTIHIMKIVDTACYVAKDSGRDRIHVYSDEDEDYLQHSNQIHWASYINKALEQDRFTLYAQTIVPVATDKHAIHYYEVLVRMLAEDGSIVSPDSFLPAAERFNLAAKIDRWVIQHALNFLMQNPEISDSINMLFINLSGQSLTVPDFQEVVATTLLESNIDPRKICFEITETSAITNLSSATIFMNAIKELGCRFALDDFGSGLSSFAYLKQLPVDFIKIDGIFVKDMVKDPIDFAMVRSINDIGKIMGKQTIAEFVETDQILEKLRTIGVDFAQGYGIERPFPIEALRMRSSSQ